MDNFKEREEISIDGEAFIIHREAILAIVLIKRYNDESKDWWIDAKLVEKVGSGTYDEAGKVMAVGQKDEIIEVMPTPPGSYHLTVWSREDMDEAEKPWIDRTVLGLTVDNGDIGAWLRWKIRNLAEREGTP